MLKNMNNMNVLSITKIKLICTLNLLVKFLLLKKHLFLFIFHWNDKHMYITKTAQP